MYLRGSYIHVHVGTRTAPSRARVASCTYSYEEQTISLSILKSKSAKSANLQIPHFCKPKPTTMFSNGPKENANPTLYATLDDGNRRNRQSSALGSEAVARFSRFGCTLAHDDSTTDDSTTDAHFSGAGGAWERSVHLALADAAAASGGTNVSLLKDAGFGVPDVEDAMVTTTPELMEATFSPSPSSSSTAFVGRENMPPESKSENDRDGIDAEEVFEIIRNIQDPEHPNSLESLGVVRLAHVTVVDLKSSPKESKGKLSKVDVRFTPTIPHCSMATLIGLCLRVKLLRSLPSRFKVAVRIEPGTHASETAVNRQLDDKERVRAALENEHLRGVVDRCIGQGMGIA